MLSRFLFAVAKHPAVGVLVGTGFQYGHALLPVRRVCSTDRVLAFHHPRPSWPTHVLLVPKRRISSLLELASAPHVDLYDEILVAAHQVAQALGMPDDRLVLCANGGRRQEVQQVHFHLFAAEPYVTSIGENPAAGADDLWVLDHPVPAWEEHVVLGFQPGAASPSTGALGARAIQLVRARGLEQRGYTLVIQPKAPADRTRVQLHLIAGRRRSLT